MQAIGIVALAIAAAVAYGIVHDQVTARVCVEYFTIGHPRIFPTDDPTLLGVGWGIIATWWVGLILGVPLALAARAGRRPPRGAKSLLRPIGWLLAVMGGCALAAGTIGWVLASGGSVVLIDPLATMVPRDRHVAFIADLWAHGASYLTGFIGGLVLGVVVWRARRSEPGPVPPAAPLESVH